jgi:alpha-L-fucosidase
MIEKIEKKFILIAALFLFISEITNAQVQTESMLKRKQENFLEWKFGMFIHFGMGTFANREWATGHEDPGLFNPSQFNAEQWVIEAKSAGMKYAVLTAKHTGGYCLWPSEFTDNHDITAFYNYKNGKGDIVKDYVNACKKYGLKVGLYYCLPGDYSERYGNIEDKVRGFKITCEQEDLHGLPPEAKGDFQNFIENQITELLTKYGDIDLLWFDQFGNKYTGKYWLRLKELVHRLQPNCVVIANNSRNFNQTDIFSYEYPYFHSINQMEKALPPENNIIPSEVSDAVATHDWFWNNERPQVLQNAEDIVGRLQICNSRNSNYLLNVQPDKNGLISGPFLVRLREIGDLIREKRILKN